MICCFPRDVRDWETGRSYDVESLYLKNIGRLFHIPLEALVEDDLRKSANSCIAYD